MAEIRPFRGVHYNREAVKDLARVICPPYDVIPPWMQEELYRRSEYNFVRLEHTRELPGERDSYGKYGRSAETLRDWLEQGILETDDRPSIYVHDHLFQLGGREYRRRGIIGLVRLEEWDRGVVRPHEGTLSEPKSDRLNLLWTLQASTSSIFVLYSDEEGKAASVLEERTRNQPLFDFHAGDGEHHRLWAVDDRDAVGQIRRSFADRPLYIADGHHRYESALAYSHERRICSPSAMEGPHDFAMMTLVDFADPGLVILPAHRMVRGISPTVLGELLPELETFFHVEQVPLDREHTGRQLDALLERQPGEVKLVLAGLLEGKLLVLRLRDFAAASRMMPYFHSDIYKKLEVSVLDHVVLENLLGLGFDREVSSLAYCYDRVDAVNRMLGHEFQLAILLNPVEAGAIKSIADAGDRMPRKSTYFYPKLPAGLVLYRHDPVLLG